MLATSILNQPIVNDEIHSHVNSKVVKASFKDCALTDRARFKMSKCLVLISVGSPAHEELKFDATIKLINRSFKSCTILVGDTLQRHNLQFDMPHLSDAQLYSQASQFGDLWVSRNSVIYNQLSIPYNILRWNDLISRAEFISCLDKIQELYQDNSDYRMSFKASVEEYLARFINKVSLDSDMYNKMAEACLNYLKEECAAMFLWVENGYDFELYPSGRNPAMAATYSHFIEISGQNLLKSVALRFKKS